MPSRCELREQFTGITKIRAGMGEDESRAQVTSGERKCDSLRISHPKKGQRNKPDRPRKKVPSIYAEHADRIVQLCRLRSMEICCCVFGDRNFTGRLENAQ